MLNLASAYATLGGTRVVENIILDEPPISPEDRLLPLGLLNDAEAVTVGVFQHDKVVFRAIFLRIPGRPDLEQPLHLALLIGSVEIQVHPARFPNALERFQNLVQRHVGTSSCGIAKYHPTVLCRLPGYVTERSLPERQHLVELVAPDDDRTDLHLPFFDPSSHKNKNTANSSLLLARMVLRAAGCHGRGHAHHRRYPADVS